MLFYNKQDMIYSDYRWSAIDGDNPKITGKLDKTEFNRNERYEVLYLINAVINELSLSRLESAKKVEQMIRYELPSNIRSQENVKNWILKNWEKSSCFA